MEKVSGEVQTYLKSGKNSTSEVGENDGLMTPDPSSVMERANWEWKGAVRGWV